MRSFPKCCTAIMETTYFSKTFEPLAQHYYFSFLKPSPSSNRKFSSTCSYSQKKYSNLKGILSINTSGYKPLVNSRPNKPIAPWRISLANFAVKYLGWKKQADLMYIYRVAHDYYILCAQKATIDGDEQSRKFWYEDCQVDVSFTTWFQITQLHLWMLSARFRVLPSATQAKKYQQGLVDSFFGDCEIRLDAFNINSRFISSSIRDLLQQYHGSNLAYDESLCKNDPVLAAALWRNIFLASPHVSMTSLDAVTKYVRENIINLANTSDKDIIDGRFVFLLPKMHKLQIT